ncbi:Methyltransferase domain-containing protein [Blastococcus aurantiacus]|uniref:Methyltransferase domain-containing protein n=1 Tax=Blastococcus aurantiacus TaxID=1550231 RepID=A0A1G7KEY2_9ACTN|nr:class I SAM-dependent methyltransferase [Blastococcus aurantiacus]SDF35747.1 Methyltransferase domain-containing protein [Blastococcus aurantiacus]
MHAYYDRGHESARLDSPFGMVELLRTQEIVLRALPPAPAVVADIGGGPGRYALWLAESGYEVEHRDLVQRHVDELAVHAPESVRTKHGDARALDLPDASVDAVLLLGPLYHLGERAERVLALQEAARVVRPGGPVFVAAISRWAPRLHGLVAQRLYEPHPRMREVVDRAERDGGLEPAHEGGFPAYTHRPDELRAEVLDAGLTLRDMVAVEGIAFALGDLDQRVATAADLEVVLEAARAVERVPELLGLGPHLIATAVRPAAGQAAESDAP